ncbi:MAG: RNA polymerase sigma factor, partial [Microthrixaceae bacterium]
REAVLPEAEPVGLDASDLDLRDALAQLSDRQREAVVMFHLLDLPIAGCAEVMGLSEPTVKTHLQRGRDRLRQLLAESELENAET